MAQLGGFLGALGQAFSGYGQDQQLRFQHEQEMARMAMQQRAGDDAHLDALLARATNYPMMPGGAQASGMPPGAQTPTPPGAGQGQPQGAPQAPTPMVRRGDGFTASPGFQAGSQSAPPSPAQPQAGGPLSFLDALPSDAVDVPGYGRIDRYGGLRKQIALKKLESDIDSDAKVDVAKRTGTIAKNAADTTLATRNANEIKPGDPGYIQYMSTLDASKAMATLPVEIQKMVKQGQISLGNALVEEDARASNARGLQGSQQQFEQGQQGRQQQFERGQQAGAYLNRSSEINQSQRGGMWGRMWAPPPATSAPSATPRLTAEQVLRAAHDPLYAKFLQSKSY